jgi:hypothetical protein
VSSTLASVPNFDEVKREPDDALTAYSYFPPVESALGELIDELFVKNWSCIVVRPCIEGAVFEIRLRRTPAGALGWRWLASLRTCSLAFV